jgi:hypothetical protein
MPSGNQRLGRGGPVAAMEETWELTTNDRYEPTGIRGLSLNAGSVTPCGTCGSASLTVSARDFSGLVAMPIPRRDSSTPRLALADDLVAAPTRSVCERLRVFSERIDAPWASRLQQSYGVRQCGEQGRRACSCRGSNWSDSFISPGLVLSGVQGSDVGIPL